MKIRIISAHKTKESYILSGEREYLKRLQSPPKVQIVEVNKHRSSALSNEELRVQESEEVFSRAARGDLKIALDEGGTAMTSRDLADMLSAQMNRGIPGVAFLIGGPLGWSKSTLARADSTLSLSKFTLPHQLARLILIEQLYRAVCILGGTPYHK